MEQRMETQTRWPKKALYIIEELNNAQDGIIIFLMIILQMQLRLNIE